MEIIVLFAIIGIISSIIKNAAVKSQQIPPVVHRKSFDAKPEEPVSLEGTSLESSVTEGRSPEVRFPASKSTASYPKGYRAGTPAVSSMFTEKSAALQVESLEGEHTKTHELDFSESGLLSGIILSEVLGPPKAYRK